MSAPDVTREYPLTSLTQGGKALPIDTIQPAHPGARFRAITIDNSSNCAVALFVNRYTGGTPTATLTSFAYKTLPLDAFSVTIAIQGPAGDQPRGSVYVHCTEERLSAAAGFSSGSIPTFVWDQSRWDSGDQFGA